MAPGPQSKIVVASLEKLHDLYIIFLFLAM